MKERDSQLDQKNVKEFNEKFLFFYMQETWNEMRHVEDLRHKVSVTILAISSALIGFLVSTRNPEDTIQISSSYISIFLIILGVFGFLKTRKLYQLHQQDQDRLDEWYKYIDVNWSNEINSIKLIADKKNSNKFWLISKFPHNHFWSILHLAISYIGLILLMDILDVKGVISSIIIVLGIFLFLIYFMIYLLRKKKQK